MRPTPVVEAYLPGVTFSLMNGNDFNLQNGAVFELNLLGWVDISADVADRILTYTRGLRNADPIARLASPGQGTFYLDNAETNSAGLAGYYSPGSTNVRSGWGKDTKVRIGFNDGAATIYRFWGWVSRISPTAGKFGDALVEVKSVDFMELLNDFERMRLVAQLEDTTEDVAFQEIVNAMARQPEGTNFSASKDILPWVFVRSGERSSSAYEEMDRVAKSTFSKVFVDKSGNLKSLGRLEWVKESTAAFALSDTDHSKDILLDVDFDDDRGRGIDRVVSITYPIEKGADNTTVFELQNPIRLNPGQSYTLVAEYKDPNSNQNVGLDDPVTLVADTHYKFGSGGDGSQNDLNSKLGVSATFYSGAVEVTFTNNGSRVGFVNTFAPEGLMLTAFDPIESRTVIDSDGNREVRIDMPYQESEIFAADGREMVKNVYQTGQRLNSVRVNCNDSDGYGYVMDNDIGTRFTVTETNTGLTAKPVFFHGETVTYRPGGFLEAVIFTAPASPSARGKWGQTKWGQNTWAFAEG